MKSGKEALQDAADKELDHCLQSRGYVEPPPPSTPLQRVLVVLDDATRGRMGDRVLHRAEPAAARDR
jgi:hypothetical protein